MTTLKARAIESTGEIKNRLLRAFPEAGRRLIHPHLRRVELGKDDVIRDPGMPFGSLFFLERGMVSLVKHMEDGRSVEIVAVGAEGVVDPFGVFCSERAILQSIVQLPGEALAIGVAEFRDVLAASPDVRAVMHRYVRVAMSQVVQTAACNALHGLEQRAARWLLIAHDCASAETFPLTHEFLAMMLAVHRGSISLAVSMFERDGLIKAGRGRITVTNRAGLEAASCECYRTMRAEIVRAFD